MLENERGSNIIRNWLAGSGFIVADDVMVTSPLTTLRYFYPYSLSEYPNILKYLQNIGERDAYKRAMAKGF